MKKKNNRQVAVIDIKMGNLFSVIRACEFANLDPIITTNIPTILESDALILPGVGAFGDAMNSLREMNLITTIKDFVESGKPLMGICLGMQLLFTESNEFGIHKGLELIEGSVIKFPSKNQQNEIIKVPHMGWSRIFQPAFSKKDYWVNSPLCNIQNGEFMYFVHSYISVPKDQDVGLSNTYYEGTMFCSSVKLNNVFGCQFHPEKSGKRGIQIYKNWATMI
jgi:glutamine amidotransferase